MERKPGHNPKQYGHIRNVPILTTFASRRACSEAGVHAPFQAGIHGNAIGGAYSVVLSGGYPDDRDEGEIITYTGEGGRDYYKDKVAKMQGKRRWAGVQNADQEWTRGNLALKRSCEIGNPVRVVRGSNLPSPYAPIEGYRYDGLYTVSEATRTKGKEGFMMCKFTFVRIPGQEPLPRPLDMVAKPRKRVIASKSPSADAGDDSGHDTNPGDEPLERQAPPSVNALPGRVGPPAHAHRHRIGPPIGARRDEPVASSSRVRVEDLPRSRTSYRPQSTLMKKLAAKAKGMGHFRPENTLIKRSLADMKPKPKKANGSEPDGCKRPEKRGSMELGISDVEENDCDVLMKRQKMDVDSDDDIHEF